MLTIPLRVSSRLRGVEQNALEVYNANGAGELRTSMKLALRESGLTD